MVDQFPTDPFVEEQRAHLADLRASNKALYERVCAPTPDGRRPHPDPLGVLALRVNTLIEHLLIDPPRRLAYDIAFEEAMVDILQQCLDQRERMNLLTPAPPGPSNGLILPGGRS